MNNTRQNITNDPNWTKYFYNPVKSSLTAISSNIVNISNNNNDTIKIENKNVLKDSNNEDSLIFLFQLLGDEKKWIKEFDSMKEKKEIDNYNIVNKVGPHTIIEISCTETSKNKIISKFGILITKVKQSSLLKH
jgi:hypothetical protein